MILGVLILILPGMFVEGKDSSSSNGVTCKCGWKNDVKTTGSLNIIGGNVVEDYQYPFIASLIPMDEGENHVKCGFIHCGATIISEWHLVTAAHCIRPDQTYAIVASASRIQTCAEGNPQIRKVAAIAIHPGYSSKTLQNDIALLTLSSSLQFTDPKVGPTCLPSMYKADPLKENDKVTAMGWGATATEPQGSDILLETSLTVMNFDKCVEAYKNSSFIPSNRNTQFCTYNAGTGICWGDSGGPMLSRDLSSGLFFQRGIISFGPESCSTLYPSVHTRIAPYVTWIMKEANRPLCFDT